MASLRKPYDNYSARDVMMKYTDLAYSLDTMDIFQEAINILYGKEFAIVPDFNKRMTFNCKICIKDMTSESAVADHFNSGVHQKNLNKDIVTPVERKFQSQASFYAKNTLQYQLLQSHIKPLGLQMVEEYVKSKGASYFKCNLCAAHGKADAMLNHLIAKKHTDRYIKSRCVLENSIITNNERQSIRNWIVDREGVNCDLIRKIEGGEFFPQKWLIEGIRLTPTKGAKGSADVNEDKCRDSRSPPPVAGTSRQHHSSSSESPSPNRHSRVNSRSRHRSSSSECPSPSRHSNEKTKERGRSRSASPESSRDRSGRSPNLSRYRNQSPPVRTSFGGEEQQTYDLENLAMCYTYIVKTQHLHDSLIVDNEGAKATIDLIDGIAEALFFLTKNHMKEGPHKDRQVQTLQKLMGYVELRLKKIKL